MTRRPAGAGTDRRLPTGGRRLIGHRARSRRRADRSPTAEEAGGQHLSGGRRCGLGTRSRPSPGRSGATRRATRRRRDIRDRHRSRVSGCPRESRGWPRPPATGGRGSDAGMMTARISRLSRRKPRSSWSRSAIDDSKPGIAGIAILRSVSSTSTRWRRSRRASSMQARTSRRLSHASNESGSRSVGRSRQAFTSAFCTASLACSTSRRISQAAASSRGIAAPASSAKAS
jgi:hypothetical protein